MLKALQDWWGWTLLARDSGRQPGRWPGASRGHAVDSRWITIALDLPTDWSGTAEQWLASRYVRARPQPKPRDGPKRVRTGSTRSTANTPHLSSLKWHVAFSGCCTLWTELLVTCDDDARSSVHKVQQPEKATCHFKDERWGVFTKSLPVSIAHISFSFIQVYGFASPTENITASHFITTMLCSRDLTCNLVPFPTQH